MRNARRLVSQFERLEIRSLLAVDAQLLADSSEVERSLLAAGGWVSEIGRDVVMAGGLRAQDLWKIGAAGSSEAAEVKDFDRGGLTMLGQTMPVPLGSRTVFIAADVLHGAELWASDGTEAGTILLRDILTGPAGSSAIRFGAKVGNELYFWATDDDGLGLWKTDGSIAGTVRVLSSRDAHNLRILQEGMAEHQGEVYFNVSQPSGKRYLAKVDATSGQVQLAQELPAGRSWHMQSVGSRLLLIDGPLFDPPTRLLSFSATEGLKTIMTGALRDESPVVLGDRLYFGVNQALWSSDGTAAGTTEFVAARVDFRSFALGPAMAQIGSRVMLVKDGVYQVKDISTGSLLDTAITYSGQSFNTSIVVDDNRFVFVGREGFNTLKLYSLAADSDQPQLVREINYSSALAAPTGGNFAYPLVVQDRLFYPDRLQANPGDTTKFNSTILMMETNVTTGQTTAINPEVGTFGSNARVVAMSDQWTWFTTKLTNEPLALWQTDGTPSGTVKLAWPVGLETAETLSHAQWIRDQLIFDLTVEFSAQINRVSWDPSAEAWQTLSARTDRPSSPVWEMNGGLFQTRYVNNDAPVLVSLGADFSILAEIVSLPNPGGRTVLTDYTVTQANGFTLLSNRFANWITDGTSVGTRLLSTPNPLSFVDYFIQPMVIGQDIWLINKDSQFYTLSAGDDDVQLVGSLPDNIFPINSLAGEPDYTWIGDKFLFTAEDSEGVQGLYVTDGTAAGTRLVRPFLDGQEDIIARVMGVVDGRGLIMTKNRRVGSALWMSDGTFDGTYRIHRQPYAIDFLSLNYNFLDLPDGRVLFDYAVPEYGRELWLTDGTSSGTQLFSDINTGSGPGVFEVLRSGPILFANASSDQHGDVEVYAADLRNFQNVVTDPMFYIEEERVGIAVGQVPANDPLLTNPVSFRLHDPAMAATFLLSESTGFLRLQPTVSLDYETSLQSSGTSGSLVIDIDYRNPLNDEIVTRQQTVRYEVIDRIEPLVFDDQSTTVDEGLERGTYLMTLAIEDFPASHVQFQRLGGHAVEVDPVSGRIYVADPNVLNYEVTRVLSVLVRATDLLTGYVDTALVTINLRDVDEPPLVTGSLADVDMFSGSTRTLALPGDLFTEPEQEALSFSLRAGDGGPLPAWVAFNSAQREATFMPPANEIGSHTLQFVASDPGGNTASIPLKINVFNGSRRWHNSLRPLDVNRDNFVTALDALIIINRLNTQTSASLPADNPDMNNFYDTSADNFVTPLDALLVINALNSGSGEGERVIPAEAPSAMAVDQLLGGWWFDEGGSDFRRRTSR